MPKFKSLAKDTVLVWHLDRNVDPGAVVDIPGEVVEELADAHVVEHNGIKHAWPKVNWELVVEAKPEPAAPVEEAREVEDEVKPKPEPKWNPRRK